MNATRMRRVEFLGCPVDCLTSEELLAELKHAIISKAPSQVIQFVNANKVAMVRSEPWMGPLLERADYVLADGQPMLPLAAKLPPTAWMTRAPSSKATCQPTSQNIAASF